MHLKKVLIYETPDAVAAIVSWLVEYQKESGKEFGIVIATSLLEAQMRLVEVDAAIICGKFDGPVLARLTETCGIRTTLTRQSRPLSLSFEENDTRNDDRHEQVPLSA